MKFTYGAYADLIERLKEKGYRFCFYNDWEGTDRSVIMRHDIDMDLGRAVSFARLENEHGIRSTYFILLSTNFYNIFSVESRGYIDEIRSLGHDIGLHFDEVKYRDDYGDAGSIKDHIVDEACVMSRELGTKVYAVSMHRPSKEIIAANLHIPGYINSYSEEYTKGFKYFSDSRKRWREDVDAAIESGEYDRLQILTHPIWYDKEEISLHDSVLGFVNLGSPKRYEWISDNLTDIDSIISASEVR